MPQCLGVLGVLKMQISTVFLQLGIVGKVSTAARRAYPVVTLTNQPPARHQPPICSTPPTPHSGPASSDRPHLHPIASQQARLWRGWRTACSCTDRVVEGSGRCIIFSPHLFSQFLFFTCFCGRLGIVYFAQLNFWSFMRGYTGRR